MKLRSLLLAGITFFGVFAGSAFAQQGELIASQNYIKPGCVGWVFLESGPGHAGDPTHRYEAYSLTCNGVYVASKTITLRNNVLETCNINLLETTTYTLNATPCAGFEIRTKAIVTAPVPAILAYAYIGNFAPGCGNRPNCTAPQYFVAWPVTQYASYYQYLFNGGVLAGTTPNPTMTIAYGSYGSSPIAGQVRACNVNNQCGPWRTVTPVPQ